MIYLMTQDTSCSKIYQTGNHTNQLQVASKGFNGKCIDRSMREIGQKLSSIMTNHLTTANLLQRSYEVSDVKIELSDEKQKQDMVQICNIQEVSYHRSHSTTMDTENILSVSKNKLEVSDDKFRNQLIKCSLQDVQQLGANPTGGPIHFTFAGTNLEQCIRVFVQSVLSANSFVTEEQFKLNELKSEQKIDLESNMILTVQQYNDQFGCKSSNNPTYFADLLTLMIDRIMLRSIREDNKGFFNTSGDAYYVSSTGSDTNPCSLSQQCRTLNAANVKNNVNNASEYTVYILDNTTLSSNLEITQTSTPRVFTNNPTSSTINSKIQINTGGQFNITGSAHFEWITFTMQSGVSNVDGGIINANLSTGGALYLRASNQAQAILSGTNFYNCSSIFSGGGLFIVLYESVQLTISGTCLFYNCSNTNSSGGGCFIQTSLNSNCTINITGELQFDQCKANEAGGMFLVDFGKGNTEINNLTFKDCNVKNSAGGGLQITIMSDAQVTITGKCTFLNCQCIGTSLITGGGGGLNLRVNGSGSIINFTGKFEFDQCKANYGGGIYISTQNSSINIINSQFLNCRAITSGGGIYSDIQSNESVELRNVTFDNCSAVNGGASYSSISAGGKLIFKDSCKFSQCKATSGNGGAIYIDIDFDSEFEFIINDATIRECEAKTNTSSSSPTGYGGGIFLTGTGDYDPLTKILDFKGMKIIGNNADNGGLSLYVAMSKLAEWCRTGIAGEYVKGNYTDRISNKSELQGIPVDSINFKALLIDQLQLAQKPLEYYWNVPQQDIWHVQSGLVQLISAEDQFQCGNIDDPCVTIEYALKQISIRKGGSETSSISEKKIGITQGGFELSDPIEFNQQSYTGEIKIMKQMYGTSSAMNGQAQLTIKKGGDQSIVENDQNGWISAIGGLQLRIYGIKIITDQSKLTIPIIYIQDSDSLLELNAVTFSGIKLSPTTEAKGIVHILQNSQFIASNCIFENIQIEEQGGNAIRLVNNGQFPFTVALNTCEFNNINSVGDSNSRGGSAIYMENNNGIQLHIDESCQFYKCITDKGNGGAIYVETDFTSEFEFKINSATIKECQIKADTTKDLPPTGYGGGIFLIGSGDYDPSTNRLDLTGMNITGNTAEKAGQSLYVVMTKLQEWCRTGTQGQYVKGNYSDTLSNTNEIEGIAKDQSSFNTLYPQEIQAQQNHLQYFWTSQIASLISVGVILNVSNTDAPLQFSIKGRGMIQDKLCVKLIEIESKTSVNLILILKQANAIEVVYPPEDGSGAPITVTGDPSGEQTATFGMKDYQWYDSQKKYNILLSNDRKIFTGVEGKEDSGISLDVEEIVVEEPKEIDSPGGFKLTMWMYILIGGVAFLIIVIVIIIICCICRHKRQKDRKEENIQMNTYNQTYKQEPYVPQSSAYSYNSPSSSSYVNQNQSQLQNQGNYSARMNQSSVYPQSLSQAGPDVDIVAQILNPQTFKKERNPVMPAPAPIDPNAPFNTTWDKSDFEKVKKLG
ncbi:MAG: hypothetical protein EZS28_023084, partial [Streblomastix strix]